MGTMMMNSQIIKLVINQINDALLYIPDGCVWAMRIVLVVLILGIILKFVLHKNIGIVFWQKLFVAFFFIVYAYCVLQLTIFSRHMRNYGGIDWRFLARWNENDAQKAFLIANIIMFIPLGILLPMVGKWARHIMLSLPVAMLSSICIEAVQLKYQLGYCQLDDVVVNTIGFLIGFLIFLMIYDIYLLVYNIVKITIKMIKKLIAFISYDIIKKGSKSCNDNK